MSHKIAGYLPDSMIIRLKPDACLLDLEDPSYKPTPQVVGFFFHEYFHYLHNISTVSGIVAFMNTVNLWRWFRGAANSGESSQSTFATSASKMQSLGALLGCLAAVRRDGAPALKYIMNPAALKITSADWIPAAAQADSADTLLHQVVCGAEVFDGDGNCERCIVRVGTLEILECAAWLLEKQSVLAVSPNATLCYPPIMPNRVVESLASFNAPALNEETVLACALGALQSSDAPEELLRCFAIAGCAINDGKDPILELRQSVSTKLANARGELGRQFQVFLEEFSGNNLFAKSMRHVLRSAMEGLDLRCRNPFFERDIVATVATNPTRYADVFREIAPCAVIQERRGDENVVQRDFLYAFISKQERDPATTDSALRVVHSAFHFMESHKSLDGFASIGSRSAKCPFFTCCDLKLRRSEPGICAKTPWVASEWKEWNDASCWYGAGVYITRPPPVSRSLGRRLARLLVVIKGWVRRLRRMLRRFTGDKTL